MTFILILIMILILFLILLSQGPCLFPISSIMSRRAAPSWRHPLHMALRRGHRCDVYLHMLSKYRRPGEAGDVRGLTERFNDRSDECK